MIILWDAKGGIGSGNWGHAGRKGVKGGSAPIANNSADKIYAGGQKYKQAGGKRSVTEKRKVAYNTKKDAANAESTVSDVSLPSPVDSTPVHTASYLEYNKKVNNVLKSESSSNITKIKSLVAYSNQSYQDASLTPDEKSQLYQFIYLEKKALMEVQAKEIEDNLSFFVETSIKNGSSPMPTIISETTMALKEYDGYGLDSHALNYFETKINSVETKLMKKYTDLLVSSIQPSSTSATTSTSQNESTTNAETLTDGFTKYTDVSARTTLDSISSKTDGQKEMVHYYEWKGDWIVNNYLRDGSIPTQDDYVTSKLSLTSNPLSLEDWQSTVTPAIKQKVSQLDNAMVDTLKADSVLIRRVGSGHPVWEAVNNGSNIEGFVYSEKNFASTSMNYYSEFGGSEKIRVEIKAPRGTRGLSFANDYGLQYEHEKEFLLPRDCAFKIISRSSSGVVVELIDNGVHP